MIRTVLLAAALAATAPAMAAAKAAPKAAAVAPEPGPPTAADWRTPDPDNILVIDTNKGRVLVEMSPEVAPAHVARVKALTRTGFYDGRSFFRVIDAFMAQTGDPKDDGTGGSTMPDLEPEFSFRRGASTPAVMVDVGAVAEMGFLGALPFRSQSWMLAPMTADGAVSAYPLFCPGVAAAARAQAENSANSQFFLMRQNYPALEKRYTAWGRAIFGLDVIRAIKVGEPVAAPQDKMTKVRVMSDMPAAERPKIRVIDPHSAWFKAEVDNVRGEMGANFTPCSIRIPVEVK